MILDTDEDMSMYLMRDIEFEFDNWIFELLSDKYTCKYSVLEVCRIIESFISVMNDAGYDLPYSNVKEYFKCDPFLRKKYRRFMALCDKENI